MDPNNLKKVSELVSRFNSGIIALQNNPSADGVAAGTALYLALSKMGKHMSIVCSSKPQFELTGTDKVQQNFAASGNHLVISFPYTEGAIDKVDYNIAGNTFNLILVPTGETNKIDPKDVKFSYTGGKIDFIITVDVPNLNSLGPLYTENQNEFQGKNIINIDRHLINNNFGTVNIVNKSISSTSEIVYQIVKELGVQIDKDIATNLYTGLLAATNNFTSYSVNQNTFEASAELMKYGAVKKPIPQPKAPNAFGGAPGFGAPQNRFGQPPANPFGNPGGQFGGGVNPMQNNQSSTPFGGFGNPSPFGAPPMNQPMMDDFDDFDDFDEQPMPAMRPPMPFGQPQPQQSQFPQQMPQPPMQRPPMPQQNMQQPMNNPYQQPPMQRPMNQPPMMPQQQPQQNRHQQVSQHQNMQQQVPQNQPQPQHQQPQQNPDNQQVQAPQQQQPQQQPNQPQQQKSPQDWLKPKLFRGNNLI